MNVQINGRPLSEVAPKASEYFNMIDTIHSLAISALVSSIEQLYSGRIQALEANLRINSAILEENVALLEEVEALRAKLRRPKAGRPAHEVKGPGKALDTIDMDETTLELMEEAYDGRRLRTKAEVKNGK